LLAHLFPQKLFRITVAATAVIDPPGNVRE